MRCLFSLLLLGLTACTSLSPLERTDTARQLAAKAGWLAETLSAGRFQLLSLHPSPRPVEVLTVFIEGDGMAWIDSDTPSSDPTPTTPVALQLALADASRPVAYLGRPCQYDPAGTPQYCTVADWTTARFSAEIIASMNAALTQLKLRFHAQRLVLVGYSGGATIAALLATRRDDVTQLITVAGLLDHVWWAQQMRVSPLTGSLNPADEWDRLKQIPQLHYFGDKDRQTGKLALRPAIERPSPKIKVIPMPGFNHECCWVHAWPKLAREQTTAP